MSDDKTTVSISLEAQGILDELVKDRKYFATELGAFLAAAALAVAAGLAPETETGAGASTKWNRGSGAISEWASFASWYIPTTEPIKALEGFGEAGLRLADERLKRGLPFSDVFRSDPV